jgi:hypothetical protein
VNTFESKGSLEPPPTMQEVKIPIKRLRGHKGPGTGLVEAEGRIIFGQYFLKSIHKWILLKLDTENSIRITREHNVYNTASVHKISVARCVDTFNDEGPNSKYLTHCSKENTKVFCLGNTRRWYLQRSQSTNRKLKFLVY